MNKVTVIGLCFGTICGGFFTIAGTNHLAPFWLGCYLIIFGILCIFVTIFSKTLNWL